MQPAKKRLPFQFVLDELLAIRPDVRQVFGFTHVYLDQMLLLSLRDNPNQPRFNGVWIYTQSEYFDSLQRYFPALPKRCFWRSKKTGNGWIILPAGQEDFEEYALKACELILQADKRIGRLSRRR